MPVIADSSLGDPWALGNLPKPSMLKLFWLTAVPLWGCSVQEAAPAPAALWVSLCHGMVTSGEGHSLWECCDGKGKGGAGVGWLQDRAMAWWGAGCICCIRTGVSWAAASASMPSPLFIRVLHIPCKCHCPMDMAWCAACSTKNHPAQLTET